MRKFYSKMLLTLLVTVLFSATASAQVTDLSGVYTLKANGFTNNTGAIPEESTIRIYKGVNDEDEEVYYIYGLLNRSNNTMATYDADAKTLSIPAASYVYGASSATGMTMIFVAGVDEDGASPSYDDFTMNVADDGTISFDNTLGFFSFIWPNVTLVEGITGGTLTKQDAPATLTSEDLVGTYSFKATDVTTSDVEDRLNSNIKADEFNLTVTAGDEANTYNVSGLFGIADESVTMTYYPESGILTTNELNSLTSNSLSVATEGDAEWTAMCMFSNLNFIVNKADDGTVTLSTINGIVISVTGLDNSDNDGQAYVINGGTATKTSSTGINAISSNVKNGAAKVYSIDGRYVGNSTKSLGHGVYVVKNGKKSTKVVL